jgi:hypothetical protein
MISRAMAAIESRGGVASPREAQLLREANMGQPYNSIDNSLEPQGSVDERLTQATGIELQRTPRESVRGEDTARTAEYNAEQDRRRQLERAQKNREIGNLIKATGEAPIPPQPQAVMEAFATPAPLRTAEQVATINQARARLNPSDLSVLEMAGQDPASMKNAVERIQKEQDAKYSLTDVVATTEAKAMADDVRKKLLPVLKRFGLEKMGLRLVDAIEGGAEGMYFKNIITLALDSNNPMGVMRHEVIHALKELGAFTTGEWKVLTDMAKKKWINQFYSPETQAEYKAQYEKDGDTTQTFDEYMAEEAIAQAFRFYTETKPPSGLIANLMRRLNNVFQAIREFFMGNGVTDAEQLFLAKQIFSGIESGRMTAGRAGVGKEGAPKFSKSMQPTGDITPMSVQGIRIYNKEIETLTKKIGDRIAGMTTDQTVEDVRKAVKKLQSYTAKGLQGREWYERSAKAVLDAFNGDPVLAEKLFQIIAITSANTEVSANFTKTVNAWNQFAQGKPIRVGTTDTNKKIEALLYFGVDWEGRKTNSFYTNLLEAMDGKDTGRSTIDLHMTRMIFDKDQPTDAQYELAEKMVSLLAAKMNVPPRQVQAASWVTQKAKGMFEDYRKRNLKSDLNDNELREFAFERAVTDYSHLMKAKVKQLPITQALSEPSPSIRARTQVITGETIPSVKTEMSQMEEMSFPQKEKFTKDVLKSGAIASIADALGIKSRIRVTVASGAYESKVNPNLKVQVVNGNSATAEKDARDLAYAMSYVFKQDATPFFRADPSLLNKDQYGISFKFNRELTPAMQKKILGVMKSYLGADAGFSTVNPNEIVMINYRGEDGSPFLMSDVDFIDAVAKAKEDINKLVPIENSLAFGAKSEYPYHDWQEDSAGNAIVERLQNSRTNRPDLQQSLDNLRQSFIGTARAAVEQSGSKPRFSISQSGEVGKASLRTPPALLKQTKTDAFKRWFGKSAIVDMNGDPKVMYHGTARDITEFIPKQAAAIFVTDDPKFAEKFAADSVNYMFKEQIKVLAAEFKDMTPAERVKYLKKSYKLGVKENFITSKLAKEISKELDDNFAQNKYPKESDFYSVSEFFADGVAKSLKTGENIMPVFVRAERPFDFENAQHIEELREAYDDEETVKAIKKGDWQSIESSDVQEAIRYSGFDGFYVKEGGRKNLAVYEPNQIKSAIGNTGAFSPESKDIRYSLANNVPPAVHTKLVPNQSAGQQVTAAATNAIKAVREDGFFTNLRNGFVDETSSLGHTLANRGMSQFANNKLRADMLKHTQANSINIMTVGLQSGVPVLNSDGSIVIKRTESNMARSLILADKLDSNPYVKASKLKGGRGFVAEVARALRGADIKEEDAAMNAEGQKLIADADAMEISLNAAVKAGGLTASAIASEKGKIDKLRKEGKELADKNREKQVDDAQIQWAEAQLKNVPELKEIFGIWKDINNALTDLSEDTGVISKEQADKYRDKKFYVPLFKAREDLAEAFFRGSTAKNVAKNYKLEGADIDRNIWENLQKQYAMTIAVAYENQTRKVATEQLQGFGLAKTVDNPNDPNINLRYKEDGKIVNVIAENPNDIAAFQMMNYELGPIMKAISATTKVLRFGALVNPMFWIKQLIRDPIHASLTNSQIVTPFNSLVGFVKVLNKSSASAKILAERGVIGAVDSTVDLNEYIGQLGKEKKTPQMLSSALHKVMQIHEASDAATRVAIFDSAKKEALKKGMSEEEAINFAVFRARESINFGVRGNSQALNTLRHSIPFFQAAITSLDTVYRAATGYGLPPAEKRKAQIIFAKRAAVMALMSTLYAAMYTDDDEYKDLPDYVKDGNWLFPTTTPDGRKTFVKIPVPFEIGFLFKTIPEAAWRYYTGTSTGKEVGKSYLEGLIHNLPGGGIIIPQAFKPALEVMTNHSFFTGNPIEGMSDQGKPVVERGRNASEFSKAASQAGLEKVGLSPAKIDALFKGYFAELGGTFLMVTSDLLGSDKPTKNIEAQLGAKAFMTDPKVSKAVSDFYTLEHNAKEMTNMFTSLKKDGLFDRAREYIDDEDKKKQLIAAPVFRKIGEQLGKIKTEMRRVEAAEGMSGDDKQARINELQKMLTQTAKRGYEVAERAGISR